MSLANGLYSKDPLIQLDSAIKINRILSDGMQRNLPLGTKDLIRSGIVARFVFLLHNEEFPKLQVRRKKRTHQIVFYDDQCNL